MRVEIRHVMEHFEIYVDNEFYCSCDNRCEVDEELDNMSEQYEKEKRL